MAQPKSTHDQQLLTCALRSRDMRVFSHFRALGPKATGASATARQAVSDLSSASVAQTQCYASLRSE